MGDKSKRIWYISPKNEAASQAINDIAGFCIHTDFEIGVKVTKKIDGGEITYPENLARMPSYEGVRIFNNHREAKRLKYDVYLQETPDSKIVFWVGNKKPTKKRNKSIPDNQITGRVTKNPGTLETKKTH
jgi:hypothetical protein